MAKSTKAKKDKNTYLSLLLVILALIVVSILALHLSQSQISNQTVTNSTKIVPGTLFLPPCASQTSSITYTKIINTTGFQAVNVSGFIDYIVSSGDAGNIIYSINSTGQGQYANLTNQRFTQLYHSTNSSGRNQTYSYPNPVSNPDTNLSYDINVSYVVLSENMTNTSINQIVYAHIAVNPDATGGTYWMSLSPGFCFGGPLGLLTIGSMPYNGPMNAG